MRSLALLLSTAALCSALVTPNQKALLDTFLESQTEAENIENTESLWSAPATFSKTNQELASDSWLSRLGPGKISDHRIHLFRNENDNCSPWPGHPGYPKPGYPPRSGPDDPCHTLNECSSNSTVWELISQGHDTKQLAAMMGKDSELIKILSSTEHNFTIFAPTDRALDRLRGRDQFLSMKEMMRYHVVLGLFSLKDLKAFEHQTLPTALNVTALGKSNGDKKDQDKNKDEDKDKNLPQRLRVDIVRHSVLLNGESGIIAGNIIAKNGIIHQIDIPLTPPPTTKAVLSILPEQFSIFALALSHTGLDSHLNATKRTTGTTFAPTNDAFRALGRIVNEFLFSPQGEECLRSLLKYHLVLNRTIYSDVVYGGKGEIDDLKPQMVGRERVRFYDKVGQKKKVKGNKSHSVVHVVSPTLLDGHDVTVDILWVDSGVGFRANGFWEPTVDVLANDGVIHVLERILIPPKIVGGKATGAGERDEVTVEMLRERLDMEVRMEL